MDTIIVQVVLSVILAVCAYLFVYLCLLALKSYVRRKKK